MTRFEKGVTIRASSFPRQCRKNLMLVPFACEAPKLHV
jgi:hypothetical protein